MDTDEFLAHHGVKGMKWGVRKSDETSGSSHPRVMDLKPNADGSITIPKGAIIQRVVNSKGLARSEGQEVSDGPTYVSFTKGDNARYAAYFGSPKTLLVKEASRVVKLTTKETIKTPTPQETSDLYFKILKADSTTLEKERNRVSKTLLGSVKNFDAAVADPKSKNAYSVFAFAYDNQNYDKSGRGVNDKFHAELKKKGYNAILDPSDSSSQMFDAPVVILNGQKSLSVTSRDIVTKASNKTMSELAAEHDKIDEGKFLLQRLGYID